VVDFRADRLAAGAPAPDETALAAYEDPSAPLPAETMPGDVVPLFPRRRSPHWSAEAWLGFERPSLEAELCQLSDRQARMLVRMMAVFAHQPEMLAVLRDIQRINISLASDELDCLKAETLQCQKHLLASRHRLPDAYMRFDDAVWSLQSINRTLVTLFVAAEELGSDAIYYALTEERLNELRQVKIELLSEIADQEQQLSRQIDSPWARACYHLKTWRVRRLSK
jgi:hypothetical protein